MEGTRKNAPAALNSAGPVGTNRSPTAPKNLAERIEGSFVDLFDG